MKYNNKNLSMLLICILSIAVCFINLLILPATSLGQADLGMTVDVGRTGFDVKRPVLASACPHGCPWGELGEFVKEAMAPFGYDVILCRNCNRAYGPPLVSKGDFPPSLDRQNLYVGTTTRVNAPVDFGITSADNLLFAYNGAYRYEKDGPYKNLRLIARIEDPRYLMVAVKAASGITDLSQIAEKKLPVKILADDRGSTSMVLEYYGLTKQAVASWGGSFGRPSIINTTPVRQTTPKQRTGQLSPTSMIFIFWNCRMRCLKGSAQKRPVCSG